MLSTAEFCCTSFLIFLSKRYVHPDYILDHDDVTLHGVTPTHAFFCVSRHDVYDATTYPFTFLLQFLQSHKMVIVPHSTFHRLADSVGDPKVRIHRTTEFLNLWVTK